MRRIGRTIAAFSLILTGVSVLIIGGLWIASEIIASRVQLDAEITAFHERRRDSIRNRVDDVVDFIEAEIRSLESDYQIDMRNRVEAVADVIRAMDSVMTPQKMDRAFSALDVFVVSWEDVSSLDLPDRVLQAGGFVYRDDGEATILFVMPLPEYGLLVGTREREETIIESIRDQLRRTLAKIPIENDEYLFGGTYDGISIIGPSVGRNMWDVQDSDGIHVVRSLSQIAQAGGGFLNYHLPASTGLEPIPKTSYVRGIDRFGWYVGIGFNRDTADAINAERREMIAGFLRSRITIIILALLVLIGLGVVTSMWFAAAFDRNIAGFTEFAVYAAKDRRLIDEGKIEFVEFRQLAGSINAMVETLRAAIDEKSVLLQEVHHRVKNNMQIISSLLSLQEANEDSVEHGGVFVQTRNRVGAMALVHEQLYQSHTLTALSVCPYVQDLVVHIRQSYERPGSAWQIAVECEEIELSLDRSIPLGLIITELVSNAFKYAESENPTLRVAIRRDREYPGTVELEVRDGGVGFTPEDLHADKGLGLTLVDSLVKQLHGSRTVVVENGTRWLVRFPA